METNTERFNVRLIKLENGKFRFEYGNEIDPSRLLIKYETDEENDFMPLRTFCSASDEFLPIPGMSYNISVALLDPMSGNVQETWDKTIARCPEEYKYMPKNLLTALMIRASNFYHDNIKSDNNGPYPVQVFQRAKSDAHWRKVKASGVIETSIRTKEDGHPTRLNYSYGGIYFFALRHGLKISAFGDQMINLSPNRVLGDDPVKNYSFFFADFKCYGEDGEFAIKKSRWPMHYLTIAICSKGSEEESYCNTHLIELSPVANPFFVIQPRGNSFEFKVFNSNQVWIEIFLMKQLAVNPSEIRPFPVEPIRSRKVVTEDCPVCSIKSLGFSGNLDSDDDNDYEAEIIRPIPMPTSSQR